MAQQSFKNNNLNRRLILNLISSLMASIILTGCQTSIKQTGNTVSNSGGFMALSNDGVHFLKMLEGEVRCTDNNALHCPYDDSSGYCTIGHGHLLVKKKCRDAVSLLHRLGYNSGITDKHAQEIFRSDLVGFERSINRHIIDGRFGNTEINQNQFDVLVSFSFNIGITNFTNSTLIKRLKSRKRVDGNSLVAKEFLRWVYSGGQYVEGLKNRRMAETSYFFKGYNVPEQPNVLVSGETNALIYLDIITGAPPATVRSN